jgi:hypothetical protein
MRLLSYMGTRLGLDYEKSNAITWYLLERSDRQNTIVLYAT